MKQFNLSALAMACMLAFAGNASAKDIYVSASGNDANDGTSAATAFATIEKAVAAAENGDVINVAGMVKVVDGAVLQGSFNEEGALLEKGAITIQGTSATTDGFDLAECAAEGILAKGYDVTLKNLTLADSENRAASFEQGVLVITGCVFSKNEGGGVFALNTNATITDCQFLKNEAENGGGADVRGGTLNMNNCVFTENYANENGGGLSIIDVADVKVAFTTLSENECGTRGGGLNITGNCENVKFTSCAIVNNESGSHGGGIQCHYSGNAELVQKMVFGSCTIANNHCANAGASFFNDGPSNNEESVLNFVNCTIFGNETDDNVGNSAGVWFLNFSPKVNIVNTILEGNWAAGNERYSDGWWRNVQVSLRNSIVGYIFQYEEYEENFAMVNTEWMTTESGTDELACELTKDGFVENCYPLVPNSLPTKMGKVEDATRFGVGVDQFGQTIDKPYLGAVMLLQGEEIPAVNGIENVSVKKVADTKFYNLAGQRVSVNAKGIIINNGKKYFVK